MNTLFRIVLLLFLLSVQLSSLNAQNADLPVNPNATFNGEQSLAIDPNDPSHLIVAWMKYHAFPAPAGMVIATSSSTNGGLTWSSPVEIPHFRPHWVSADPTLAFKNDGTVYLGYIDYKSTLDSGAVYVVNSTNGGASWSTASKVIDYNDNTDLAIDRPWLAIDNSAGPFQGTLYMVTKSIKNDPLPHHIYLMRSNNGGLNWSTPLLVDNGIPSGPTIKSMGIPAVTKTGKLLIAYAFYNPPAQPGFAVAVSSDGGLTLTDNPVATYSTNAVTNDTLLQASYNLAADPTNSANLVLSFTYKPGNDFDAGSVYSNDGGVTWSAVQRISSDPFNNGNNQDMLWASFSSTGKYAAVWRDRRANSGAQNQPYKIWGSLSTDGGVNFSSNFQLSQTDGPLMVPVDGNDFLGCALNDTVVYATWTDKRSGSNQLYFNKYRMPAITTINHVNEEMPEDMIYPNPNKGGFILRFAKSGNKEVEIWDVSGKVVYSSKTSADLISIKMMEAPGVYLLKVRTEKEIRRLRFVID